MVDLLRERKANESINILASSKNKKKKDKKVASRCEALNKEERLGVTVHHRHLFICGVHTFIDSE